MFVRVVTIVSLWFLVLSWPILCTLAREHVQVDMQVNADGTAMEAEESIATATSPSSASKCQYAIQALSRSGGGILNGDVSVTLHRNGDTTACGTVPTVSEASLQKALQALWLCQQEEFTKHEIESVMTTWLYQQLPQSACGSEDNVTAPDGLYGHCDMGPERTTIQPDHYRLVPTPSGSLPCRFYTREGARIGTWEFLADLANQARATCEQEDTVDGSLQCDENGRPTVHLYAVPASRMFMLATSYVGEKFYLNHVTDLDETKDKIVIETMR